MPSFPEPSPRRLRKGCCPSFRIRLNPLSGRESFEIVEFARQARHLRHHASRGSDDRRLGSAVLPNDGIIPLTAIHAAPGRCPSLCTASVQIKQILLQHKPSHREQVMVNLLSEVRRFWLKA